MKSQPAIMDLPAQTHKQTSKTAIKTQQTTTTRTTATTTDRDDRLWAVSRTIIISYGHHLVKTNKQNTRNNTNKRPNKQLHTNIQTNKQQIQTNKKTKQHSTDLFAGKFFVQQLKKRCFGTENKHKHIRLCLLFRVAVF